MGLNFVKPTASTTGQKTVVVADLGVQSIAAPTCTTSSYPQVVPKVAAAAAAVAVVLPLPAIVHQIDSSVAEQLVVQYLKDKSVLDEVDNRAVVKRMEAARKDLLALLDGSDESNPLTFQTDGGSITFSECGEATEVVDNVLLIEHVYTQYGPDVLNKLVSFGITALKQVLTGMELKEFTRQKPTGRRLVSAQYTTAD